MGENGFFLVFYLSVNEGTRKKITFAREVLVGEEGLEKEKHLGERERVDGMIFK